MSHPNVFISYSHDTEQHKVWVLKLATDLRSHGVNVILDQWDLRLGADLRFFMEQGLSSAHLVLCICSEAYVEKVNLGKGGSGYEGMIMTQQLLSNANTEFIIPIVKNNPSSQKVPLALCSKYYIDFSDDAQYFSKYQELLSRIYDEDFKKKPPLGKNPFSDEISKEITSKTQIESISYHSPEMEGTVTFRFDNNNGIYTIGNGEYAFQTRWSRYGNGSIYAHGRQGRIGIAIEAERAFPPALAAIPKYNFSSEVRTITTGQVVVWENSYRHFAAIKMGSVKSSLHGNAYDEMSFEYHIYYPE